jgi:glycosyltransferase involved in cell wall biosynthesis
MKVALVTPQYPPAVGGVEWHARMLAIELTRMGVALDVICSDPSSAAESIDELDGISVRRFPTLRGDSTFFVSPGLARWLDGHAADYDLLHAHSYHTPMPLLAALAGLHRRVPLVCTPHFHGSGHTLARRLMHIPYRVLGAWTLRRARKVICVSEAERRMLREWFRLPASKLVVAHNGVDVEEIRGGPRVPLEVDRTVVLAVGRLEAYKNTLRVVRAAALLPESATLVVVGDGPARDDLLAAAADLGLGERLRWYASLARAELVGWYRTADVFVSMSGHEAFGMTLLEAAVAGTPVVASDIAAHREVAALLPEGAVTLLDLEASGDELAAAIRQAAERERVNGAEMTVPTWRAAAERVLAVYEGVAG